MSFLAIVIPYYKIDFFEETLKSVAAQTDKRFSLYIGNDASHNNPKPLIEKHFPNGNYHYFNYSENKGGENLVKQWERILENVTEDWFQILGDDDVISENLVEEFYLNLASINNHESNVIKCSQCWINEHSDIITNFTKHETLSNLFDILFQDRSSLSEHLFRRETYEKHHFTNLPLAWCSDLLAIVDFSEDKKIFFISNAKVLIRMSSKNISGMESNSSEKNAAAHTFKTILLNKHYSKMESDLLSKLIQQYLYDCLQNVKTPSLKIGRILLIRQKKLLPKFILNYLAITKKRIISYIMKDADQK